MTDAAGLVREAGVGVALGLQYNPIFSAVAAVIAAALLGYPRTNLARRALFGVLLAAAWVVGDGLRVGSALRVEAPGTFAAWVPIVLWVLVGFAVGYLAPAAAGVMAGRGVIRGTGWLVAGAVALMVAGAIALLAPTFAEGVARVAGGGMG